MPKTPPEDFSDLQKKGLSLGLSANDVRDKNFGPWTVGAINLLITMEEFSSEDACNEIKGLTPEDAEGIIVLGLSRQEIDQLNKEAVTQKNANKEEKQPISEGHFVSNFTKNTQELPFK